jgi:hypothetical protein
MSSSLLSSSLTQTAAAVLGNSSSSIFGSVFGSNEQCSLTLQSFQNCSLLLLDKLKKSAFFDLGAIQIIRDTF